MHHDIPGEKGVGRSGVALHYKGSKFHRIIDGFMCQASSFLRLFFPLSLLLAMLTHEDMSVGSYTYILIHHPSSRLPCNHVFGSSCREETSPGEMAGN
jgi:hypothetical protein